MSLLTKSKYLNGTQCPRLLWHANKKLLPEVSVADQHRFDQGFEFENVARKLFPEGVNLSKLDFLGNLDSTKRLVTKNKTIIEAGFKEDNLFVRSDVLKFTDNGWNLYEIKSTTSVKPQHITDLAFQKFLIEKTGIKINKCFVLFLNKAFVKHGKINPEEIVFKKEVTEQVGLIDDIETNIDKYLYIMQQEKAPEMTISKGCNNPYECPLKSECWGTLPSNNVTQLTNWRQYWKLFEEGIQDINDVPKDTILKPKDEVIRKAAVEKKVQISKEHLKHFMNTLVFPLYHFDFETFDTAVPIYDKSRPYQKIPFQYSLHIQHKDGKIEHFEYLADGKEDPRFKLLEQLESQIEGTGSVVVFNKSFEIMVLTKLAEDFSNHAEWINKVLGRIVDLATPFQGFHYYCPTQKGRYSIKKVMPAITGKGYDNLEINNGAEASVQYFNSHIKNNTPDPNLRENLLRYCCLDTEGMIWIINELNKLV
ncbi:DUF2779 domain-containing protein [Candidatus Woesearchaeota archaeon]|jgi:hypothetical protein|nr:DUF2779 domain-containing protein [Candidatus Woesearchaeota archaeon]